MLAPLNKLCKRSMLNEYRLNNNINLVLYSRLMFDLAHFNNTGNICYTFKYCVLYQLYSCKARAIFCVLLSGPKNKTLIGKRDLGPVQEDVCTVQGQQSDT